MVGPGGLEPPTSRLSGVCSNQLSYRPETITPHPSLTEGRCGGREGDTEAAASPAEAGQDLADLSSNAAEKA